MHSYQQQAQKIVSQCSGHFNSTEHNAEKERKKNISELLDTKNVKYSKAILSLHKYDESLVKVEVIKKYKIINELLTHEQYDLVINKLADLHMYYRRMIQLSNDQKYIDSVNDFHNNAVGEIYKQKQFLSNMYETNNIIKKSITRANFQRSTLGENR